MDSNAEDNTSSAPVTGQGRNKGTPTSAPVFSSLALRPKRKRDTDDGNAGLTAKRRDQPVSAYRHHSALRSDRIFQWQKLPSKVETRILEFSLLKDGPITIDSTWCERWLDARQTLPTAIGSFSRDDEVFETALLWTELAETIDGMQYDYTGTDVGRAPHPRSLIAQLGHHLQYSRAYTPPCRDLATGLFRVNKEISQSALDYFYTENTFRFPHPANAWMEFDAFLSPLGVNNINRLRSICIHVPPKHLTLQEDVLAGVIFDFISVAKETRDPRAPSRFETRTLSAVRSSLSTLQASNTDLSSLRMELQDGEIADLWTGAKDRMLWTEDEDFVEHENRNVQLKRELLRLTAQYRPVVVALVRAPSGESDGNEEFSRRLRDVGKEAEEFGWEVDPYQSSM
ncbi:hypothetical protein MBLNU230_g3817t1 [Neophaeotheca triangularis]